MKHHAFTLTELLVTMTIIGILAGLLLGAVSASREAAHEYATKATIVKLNNIIMERYESYMTRRVPIDTSGMPPRDAAVARLGAIRDLIRVEMPERIEDILNFPLASPSALPSRPAISQLYLNYYNAHVPAAAGNSAQAELLYLMVSKGSPEAMEQFNMSEIGDSDDNGWPEFLDGWGRPIFFLRWAPGYSGCTAPDFIAATGIHYNGASSIQSGVAQSYPKLNPDGTPAVDADGNTIIIPGDHDPFDAWNLDVNAFHLIPFIYSAGSDGKFDIDIVSGHTYTGDPYSDMAIGEPYDEDGDGMNHHDNITNHHIEQR